MNFMISLVQSYAVHTYQLHFTVINSYFSTYTCNYGTVKWIFHKLRISDNAASLLLYKAGVWTDIYIFI